MRWVGGICLTFEPQLDLLSDLGPVARTLGLEWSVRSVGTTAGGRLRTARLCVNVDGWYSLSRGTGSSQRSPAGDCGGAWCAGHLAPGCPPSCFFSPSMGSQSTLPAPRVSQLSLSSQGWPLSRRLSAPSALYASQCSANTPVWAPPGLEARRPVPSSGSPRGRWRRSNSAIHTCPLPLLPSARPGDPVTRCVLRLHSLVLLSAPVPPPSPHLLSLPPPSLPLSGTF